MTSDALLAQAHEFMRRLVALQEEMGVRLYAPDEYGDSTAFLLDREQLQSGMRILLDLEKGEAVRIYP